ncbi:uncharacterized protein LOC127657639 [Xyrauchen texanus]|uniref:uncharacterized protein LOC127657639 n=1 Tax=Xyrauchen texanus TaxID=154827 RepID=UPI0022422D93|nr:uncharacterized protein LOC127657639 [Xyrauchen texanus]
MSSFKIFILLFALWISSGECDDVFYKQAGSDISLSCGVPSDREIEWKFNDTRIFIITGKTGARRKGTSKAVEHIISKVHVNGDKLKLPKLETRDSGVYSCRHMQSEKKYTVHVVSVFAKPPLASPGSGVELHCNIEGEQQATVQWLSPLGKQYSDQVISLKSVTSNDDGKWTCQVKDLKINVTLAVVGLQTKDVEVLQGGNIVLPCSLSNSISSPRVVGGNWKADHFATDSFPALENSYDKGLHWNGKNTSKVRFTRGQLTTNFDINLINVQRSDEGIFVFTVEFEGGLKQTAKMTLKVIAAPAVPSVNGPGQGPWTKDVLGVKLWVWIAVGASSLVLIGLIILTVLVQRRNKQMQRRVRKLRSMRQPLTAKEYCQCNRSEREVVLGKQVRPVPVSRQQCKTHTTLLCHQQHHVVYLFRCVSEERSAFRGTREEERGCYGGGGEEINLCPFSIHSEDRIMLCWILISLLLQFLKAQEIDMIIYAQEGETVTLPRDKRANEENVYVNWYYKSDTTEIISRNPQSGIKKGTWTRVSLLPDFSLQISPVEDSDFDIFRCEQHVLIEKFTKTYRLYRVSIPKVPAVMVGASLTMNCELETSPVSRLATVSWIQPNNSACKLEIISYPKNKISVQGVPSCASGVWKCKVTYRSQEAEATTTVSVIDLAPSPPDPIYTSVLHHPSTVDIPCFLSCNIPWSVLTNSGLLGGSWSVTQFSVQNNQTSRSLLSLSFHPTITWNVTTGSYVTGRNVKDHDLSIYKVPVSEKIRGVYTCSLKFMSKTLSRNVKVEVLRVLVSSTVRSPLYEGQGVNLTCTLGYPMTSDLEVKWKCPIRSTLPSLSSSPHPANLSIPELRLENSGRWICELWKNDKMLTSAEHILKIEKVPVDIWLWVAVSSGVVVFILLLVIAIIAIRRHKKMIMYRRRKTRFCCCKNPQPKGFYKT